ncbi:hypothetical protein BKA80DRAFT_520 [Phyllosticta citrichinensis]
MTERLSHWKLNDFKSSIGKELANLDILLDFNKKIEFLEGNNFRIGFHQIPRYRNERADWLAKCAAEMLPVCYGRYTRGGSIHAFALLPRMRYHFWSRVSNRSASNIGKLGMAESLQN